ncbi:class B sortase [Lysinibacillus macroides]|uniref:Peptidase C60 n=1 Tax=Lysinibacillus macroides TaxID=33935 RepID=A0A0N0UWL3_9BACI|nr:class B sortase [Lysinibacillus macroides]KOY81761.1 peptidase C60 [Lysinibacillus macroides]QPR67866.1 class B sortase [Lysinibacillus macroides]
MSKIRKFLIAFFTVLLVYSLVALTKNYLQDYAENQQIKKLAEIRYKENTNDERTTAPVSTKIQKPSMLPEFQELYKQNSDIIGWLKIDGTRIDYPIMQNQQNAQYYLNHGFDREKNKNGLPFLDEHSRIEESAILLIHGHHMKSGSMFADLEKYKNESYYKEHTTFQFSSLYEQEEYEIIAVILSQVYNQADDVFKYYRIEQIATPEAFDSYIQNIKQLALYDTKVTAQYGDKLIVLSTCEYSTENGRLAVVARKRE